MYTRKSWIVLTAALSLSLGLAACGDDEEEEAPTRATGPAATATTEAAPLDTLRGSGNVATEEIALTDFRTVEVANAFVVDIVRADSFRVTVRVDDNMLEFVDVSTEGDTLRIRLQQPERFADVTLEASITMPDLDGLTLSGASTANVSGFRASSQIDIDVSGASTLDGDLEAGTIDLDVSGASRVVLEGSATGLTVVGTGASSLNLADFEVETASVSLSGTSEATVNVQERIDPVDLSGLSTLRYLGDPSLGNVTEAGGSSVEKIEE